MLNNISTAIIYITGRPGMGKYTIAKALSESGFIVCDNQLINNPIFELLNYDGLATIPEFAWKAIRNIRSTVLKFLTHELRNSYVLTNNLYQYERDVGVFAQVESMTAKRGSLFVPVRLEISQDEHLRRVTNPNRRKRWKSIDPNDVYDKMPLLDIKHPNLLILDVTDLNPNEAAQKILKHIKEHCL